MVARMAPPTRESFASARTDAVMACSSRAVIARSPSRTSRTGPTCAATVPS